MTRVPSSQWQLTNLFIGTSVSAHLVPSEAWALAASMDPLLTLLHLVMGFTGRALVWALAT